METIEREGTERSPSINFDPQNGEFTIQGRSIPKDVDEFYQPLLDWLEGYSKNPAEETHLVLDLTAFNIATSKKILFILYRLDELVKKGHKVAVSWYHDESDDDMLEVGQDYANMVDVPFRIKTRAMRFEEVGTPFVI